jgi:hypothetical protein
MNSTDWRSLTLSEPLRAPLVHKRPMVERSISWLVADGCRRVPYHGFKRNHVWLSVRVAALNLRQLLTLG